MRALGNGADQASPLTRLVHPLPNYNPASHPSPITVPHLIPPQLQSRTNFFFISILQQTIMTYERFTADIDVYTYPDRTIAHAEFLHTVREQCPGVWWCARRAEMVELQDRVRALEAELAHQRRQKQQGGGAVVYA